MLVAAIIIVLSPLLLLCAPMALEQDLTRLVSMLLHRSRGEKQTLVLQKLNTSLATLGNPVPL